MASDFINDIVAVLADWLTARGFDVKRTYRDDTLLIQSGHVRCFCGYRTSKDQRSTHIGIWATGTPSYVITGQVDIVPLSIPTLFENVATAIDEALHRNLVAYMQSLEDKKKLTLVVDGFAREAAGS